MKLLNKPFMPLFFLLTVYTSEEYKYSCKHAYMEKLRMLIRDYVALGEGGKVATELKELHDKGAYSEMIHLITRISDYEVIFMVKHKAFNIEIKDVVMGDTYKKLVKVYTQYRKFQCALDEVEFNVLDKVV